jgi:hypothetical protein
LAGAHETVKDYGAVDLMDGGKIFFVFLVLLFERQRSHPGNLRFLIFTESKVVLFFFFSKCLRWEKRMGGMLR